MALTPPIQERSVDPFSDNRFSSVINRLTRVVTGGKDIILFEGESFKFTYIDYKTLAVGPGVAIKDDVLIHITDTYNLDLSDGDYFYEGTPMDVVGSYYIILQYVYIRSLPAPKAYIKIVKEKPNYLANSDNFIFLGMVNVIYDNGDGRFEINESDPFSYSDPGDTTIIRATIPEYSWVVDGGWISTPF